LLAQDKILRVFKGRSCVGYKIVFHEPVEVCVTERS